MAAILLKQLHVVVFSSVGPHQRGCGGNTLRRHLLLKKFGRKRKNTQPYEQIAPNEYEVRAPKRSVCIRSEAERFSSPGHASGNNNKVLPSHFDGQQAPLFLLECALSSRETLILQCKYICHAFSTNEELLCA